MGQGFSQIQLGVRGEERRLGHCFRNFRKFPEIAGNCRQFAGNCWQLLAAGGGGGGQQFPEISGNFARNFRQFPEIAGNYPALHFWAKLAEISGIAGNCRKFPEITGNFRKLPEISAIAGNCGNFRKLPATPALPDPFSTRTCPFFRPAPFSGPLFPPTPDRDFCRLPEGGVPQLPCGLSKFRN